MNDEDLDEKFKDPDDPLRLVFVCAMWMTGFDAPIVLDDLPRPADAEPHADADDRAGEPRLPRQGERADRRLHRRLPGPREGARDLRRGTGAGELPIKDKAALLAELQKALNAVFAFAEARGVKPATIFNATGMRA